MNTATDAPASAWIRFPWTMSHLLCGSALESAVLGGFRVRRELFVTGSWSRSGCTLACPFRESRRIEC
jgi:hypothetical protein